MKTCENYVNILFLVTLFPTSLRIYRQLLLVLSIFVVFDVDFIYFHHPRRKILYLSHSLFETPEAVLEGLADGLL